MHRVMRTITLIAVIMSAGFCLARPLAAQVTSASMRGTVSDSLGNPLEGARVEAIHQSSGTRYVATTRADGRFTLPGMRVGGPYTVTSVRIGYARANRDNIFLTLGVAKDLYFAMSRTTVTLTGVTVTADGGKISSTRSGAATSISREALEAMPTVSGRINDFIRLTPQASGSSFVGQDNRLNNVTVDGSSFNNSFGLGGQPGDRTGVAPISLGAIEQVQVNIAPFDVRQGNFVGAAVNTVTKSGTNELAGSIYHSARSQRFVGTKAGSNTVDPGTFNFSLNGFYLGGPIVRNRLFFFTSFENDGLNQPGTTFRANKGGEPVIGNTTRVLASDLDALSTFMASKFHYDVGPYAGYQSATPSRRFLGKLDFSANDRNKLSLRYTLLNSNTDVLESNSNSLGFGNRRSNLNSINFQNSNYQILENIRSTVGEWNSTVGANMSNNMIAGYTYQDESRGYRGAMFPLIDILEGGVTYTSLGFEPFTPNNELRYSTLQFQNNFSIYGDRHDFTFGVSAEKYHSENVFFPGSQSVYVYNSLADFYTDANDFLANPNRTASPVTLRDFQVRYSNIPGQVKPVQPLDVVYASAYAQDEFRARRNLRLTLGLRIDVPTFGNTGFANTQVDGLSFRDENGATAKYATSKLPNATPLLSPRLGLNWDVNGDGATQVRGGSGMFSGRPAYVWISNQIGNNGVLTGFDDIANTKTRPFNPNPDAYKPASVTGAPATTYNLELTDPNFKFPQLWRNDIAVDRKLPFGFVGTAEFIYDRDVNGIYYINANLPAAQTSFTGADKRPRWTSNRINTNISTAVVLKNESAGQSWNLSGSLERAFSNGFFAKFAYSYGEAKNTVDAGSIATGTWTGNQVSSDPNNPGLGFSANSPGHRFFTALSYKRQYFGFGATGVSLFFEGRTGGNASYTFSGDLNGDGGSNDLIYIPANVSEMNFETFTSAGKTFTAADQATAWDAYINQDDYLKAHRGQYAVRNAVFLPIVYNADVSLTQNIFSSFGSKKNDLQIRFDILNAGNMLNGNWGVGRRLVSNTPLIARGADSQGRALYRLRNIGTDLLNTTYQATSGLSDVWRMQLGVRYSFM